MLSAVPDQRRRLADGILVEATILARVLGIRILTINTTLVLVPADVRSSSSAPLHQSTHASALSSSIPSMRSGAAGRRLATAVQSINEGAELLATAQHDGLLPT
jgi:hypothetical protein